MNGKIFLTQGFRETALGASRRQSEKEAHPQAAVLNKVEADARQRYVSEFDCRKSMK